MNLDSLFSCQTQYINGIWLIYLDVGTLTKDENEIGHLKSLTYKVNRFEFRPLVQRKTFFFFFQLPPSRVNTADQLFPSRRLINYGNQILWFTYFLWYSFYAGFPHSQQPGVDLCFGGGRKPNTQQILKYQVKNKVYRSLKDKRTWLHILAGSLSYLQLLLPTNWYRFIEGFEKPVLDGFGFKKSLLKSLKTVMCDLCDCCWNSISGHNVEVQLRLNYFLNRWGMYFELLVSIAAMLMHLATLLGGLLGRQVEQICVW